MKFIHVKGKNQAMTAVCYALDATSADESERTLPFPTTSLKSNMEMFFKYIFATLNEPKKHS